MNLQAPSKRFLGFTWVTWLNYWVLQWFFVRLDYIPYYKTLNGHTKWLWTKGVIPLTGFFSRRKRLL